LSGRALPASRTTAAQIRSETRKVKAGTGKPRRKQSAASNPTTKSNKEGTDSPSHLELSTFADLSQDLDILKGANKMRGYGRVTIKQEDEQIISLSKDIAFSNGDWTISDTSASFPSSSNPSQGM
jgi:hypothetical protein